MPTLLSGQSKMFMEKRLDQPEVCAPPSADVSVYADKDAQLGCLAWFQGFFAENFPDTTAVRYLDRLLGGLQGAESEEEFTRLLSRPARMQLLGRVILGDDEETTDDESSTAISFSGGVGGGGDGGLDDVDVRGYGDGGVNDVVDVDDGGDGGVADDAVNVQDQDVVVIHLRLGDVFEMGFGEKKCSPEVMSNDAGALDSGMEALFARWGCTS